MIRVLKVRVRALAFAAGACGLAMAAPGASAQLRLATWNISNYAGGRVADIQTAVYGLVPAGLALAGKSMSPDAVFALEMVDEAASDALLAALNTAPGSPGDWAAVPFTTSPDTSATCLYRTSRLQYISVAIAVPGGNISGAPRNVMRYDLRPVGYNAEAATMACFAVHMKAGSTATDQSRRQVEATAIRNHLTTLLNMHPQWNFLLCGDLNIQVSNQAAYQTLIAGVPLGRFYDPISTPGSWNNVSLFRFVHTQDPATADGMDDRFDQFLLSESMLNAEGLDYIGAYPTAYSSTTWNDPNHSHRAWGNDGTSFNNLLKTTGNTMVGAAIAQAIINAATPAGGHIPVFIDVAVPPRIGASTLSIDFGTVTQNNPASQNLTVSNTGNTSLWTAAGINTLAYSIDASSGFGVGGSSLPEPAAGSPGNVHPVSMDTSTVGVKSGTLTITSDDPEQPTLIVNLSGEVIAPPSCPGDFNGDHAVNTADLTVLLGNFGTSVPPGTGGDMDGNGTINTADLTQLLGLFGTTCP